MISARTRGTERYNLTREVEQFRALARKVFALRRADGRELRSIAVTACEPQAGVTCTVAKLALAAAEQLPRVIAMQFERPHNALELYLGHSTAGDPPLEDSFPGGAPAGLIKRTKRERILLARIDRNISASRNRLFKSDELLEQLLGSTDALIGDLPPIADDTSTLSVVSKFDAVLLVVQAEHTRRFELRRVYQELQRLHANVVGVVLNNSGD